MTFHTAFAITDPSQIGSARRAAQRMAEDMHLTPEQAGAIGIVVTELATNLARYAQSGQILIGRSGGGGLDILALDKGPGLDAGRCMQDGFSSGGTAGNGLGAVQRMSDEFDIYSTGSAGTVVFSRIAPRSNSTARPQQSLQFGSVCVPAPGETECGDAWELTFNDSDLQIVMADGLGHGPEASQAAQTAMEVFRVRGSHSPKTFIEQAHSAMTATRGAALAAGKYLRQGNQFLYAGIGNISGTLVSHEGSRGLMSHNGTVGGRMRSVQQLEYNWSAGWMLIMHSDGIQTRWDLNHYPGLFSRHPAIFAAVLARDFNRGRDDATVVVVRRP